MIGRINVVIHLDLEGHRHVVQLAQSRPGIRRGEVHHKRQIARRSIRHHQLQQGHIRSPQFPTKFNERHIRRRIRHVHLRLFRQKNHIQRRLDFRDAGIEIQQVRAGKAALQIVSALEVRRQGELLNLVPLEKTIRAAVTDKTDGRSFRQHQVGRIREGHRRLHQPHLVDPHPVFLCPAHADERSGTQRIRAPRQGEGSSRVAPDEPAIAILRDIEIVRRDAGEGVERRLHRRRVLIPVESRRGIRPRARPRAHLQSPLAICGRIIHQPDTGADRRNVPLHFHQRAIHFIEEAQGKSHLLARPEFGKSVSLPRRATGRDTSEKVGVKETAHHPPRLCQPLAASLTVRLGPASNPAAPHPC